MNSFGTKEMVVEICDGDRKTKGGLKPDLLQHNEELQPVIKTDAQGLIAAVNSHKQQRIKECLTIVKIIVTKGGTPNNLTSKTEL